MNQTAAQPVQEQVSRKLGVQRFDAVAVELMQAWDQGLVARGYRGRSGCACGCRGRYTTDKASMKAQMMDIISRGVVVDELGTGERIFSADNGEQLVILYPASYLR